MNFYFFLFVLNSLSFEENEKPDPRFTVALYQKTGLNLNSNSNSNSNMGFFSFLGRVLFASLFILSAWQMFNDFGIDGGPAAKELIPKLAVAKKHISKLLGIAIPDVEVRHVVATNIFLKGVGGFLFVFGNSFGAFLLLVYVALSSPLLYDFYNYSPKHPEFSLLLNEFLQSIAIFGALLFFIGMKNSLPRRQHKKKAPKAKAN